MHHESEEINLPQKSYNLYINIWFNTYKERLYTCILFILSSLKFLLSVGQLEVKLKKLHYAITIIRYKPSLIKMVSSWIDP